MATYWPASALIVDSVTKTVGGAGDFATVQGAVDWFKNKLVVGACKIDVDAGSYDEAIVFDDIFIATGGSLELEGDTRGLAGISYVDGAICNQAGIGQGGTFSAGNECTLATNLARDEITVSGGTVDPNFDAGGWVNGDEILVYADDGTIYERIINSISPGGAGNNVIEITVALPAGATLGNDGTAICLQPDRQVARTSAGACIEVEGVRGILLDGWYLDSHTGGGCHGLHVHGNGEALVENVAVRAEDYGFFSYNRYSRIWIDHGATSAWDCEYGYFAWAAFLRCWYGVANSCARGFYSYLYAQVEPRQAIAVNCGAAGEFGYRAEKMSNMDTFQATARQCDTGYYSSDNSMQRAGATNAQNNGNVTDYNPLPGAIPGSAEGNNFGVLYAS